MIVKQINMYSRGKTQQSIRSPSDVQECEMVFRGKRSRFLCARSRNLKNQLAQGERAALVTVLVMVF
jgi:hypothetical protein